MKDKEMFNINIKLSWSLGTKWIGMSHRVIEAQGHNQHSTDIKLFPLFLSIGNIFGKYAEIELGISKFCSFKFGISLG